MIPYPRACFPTRFRICGCRLQPLTLGHALLLQAIGSPYAPITQATRKAKFGDFLVVLWICSRSWNKAARGIDGWRARLWLRVKLWSMVILRTRLPYREMLLAEYLATSQTMPLFWEEIKEGDSHGTPPILSLKMVLQTRWHKSESEALDTPLAQAIWEVCGFLESRGKMKIASERDMAIMAERRAARAKSKERCPTE